MRAKVPLGVLSEHVQHLLAICQLPALFQEILYSIDLHRHDTNCSCSDVANFAIIACVWSKNQLIHLCHFINVINKSTKYIFGNIVELSALSTGGLIFK